MKNYNLIFALLLTALSFIQIRGQNIKYTMFNCSSEQLTNYLNSSNEFFIGKNYYSAKNTNFTIQFYNTTGVYANYKIRNYTYFTNIVSIINSYALFKFKYCSDYNSPIIYRYDTSNGNIIRYNYDELVIQIQYPSSVNSFLDSNFEFTPVFVCTSKVSYAFHTNIKCEGLQNCESQIAKSNIKEAKKYGYKICGICTSN